MVVAPGRYFTAINVHNPTHEPISFQKKVAIASPSEQSGSVLNFSEVKLKPDSALEIDCPDIFSKHTDTSIGKGFLKGFVVIESKVELDVVAVYTVTSKDGHVAIHMERVPARRHTTP